MGHTIKLFAMFFLCPGLLMIDSAPLRGQENGYRMPPAEIAALVDAPATPVLSLSPDRHSILLLDIPTLPPIAELAQTEIALAGVRINPGTFGPSRTPYYTGIRRKVLEDGSEKAITGLPEQSRIYNVKWSPNGQFIAFTLTNREGTELWLADMTTHTAKPLLAKVNACFPGSSYDWFPDSKSLLCRQIPVDHGAPPAASEVPTGPVIQENIGKTAPARTFQDLLKSAHDESLFEFYFTVQLVRVSVEGKVTTIGSPGLHRTADVSPDGNYLLVETIHRPFSYLVPMYRFPYRVEIWDNDGHLLKNIADLPLAEEIPIAQDAVAQGPREFNWRADAPHTVYWCETQDGGDPRVDVEVRDKVWTLTAPFNHDPQLLINLSLRYSGIYWGDGHTALVSERWWVNRKTRLWKVAPDYMESKPGLVFDRSWEDRYDNPGVPVMTNNKYGRVSLRFAGNSQRIYLRGAGASPQGDFPFLDEYDLNAGRAKRLWQCTAPFYEDFIDFLDLRNERFLTRRESLEETANYFVRKIGSDHLQACTNFPHPYPQLRGIHKELIQYAREDGVQLNGTLYTPAGWNREKGPLPLLMWAYPQEYKSAAAAGQVKDSPYRFVRLSTGSPLFWLVRGYAILDNPTMPIIGEKEQQPNDTYIEQLVSSTRAAVLELQRRGVTDSSRIAIGGHSYGAFMVANLLSHSDLFKAGIARSGAYNRTLTPFGFQSEDRTLWDAPEVYAKMSPFMYVKQMNTPLLLMHGESDNNSGTFPMQSERYYAALKGMGKTVRLVLLPKESHGYRARESVMHMLWEMDQWLEKYVSHHP